MSVHETSDGRWYTRWRVQGRQMKKYFGRGPVAQDQAEAYDRLRKRARLSVGPAPTLATIVDLYLHANPLHPSTITTILSNLKKISFAYHPAELLTRKEITTLRQDLDRARLDQGKSPLSNATKNRAQAYFARALAWAVDQGHLPANPWAGAPKLKEKRYIPTATLQDFMTIFEHIHPSSEYLKWAMLVIMATANRPGQTEIFRLKWESLDLERGICTIHQAKSGALKTSYLPPWFIPLAGERKAADLARGIDLVVHRHGRPVKDYRHAWRNAKKRAGFKDKEWRLYDLRHAWASFIIKEGADPAAVQHQLGHLHLSTTLKFYIHAIEGAQKKAAYLMPDPTANHHIPLLDNSTNGGMVPREVPKGPQNPAEEN